MKSGSGWRFVDGAGPKPVEKPAQPSLQVQLPRQPVLELSDTAGMVAVARSFFVGRPPVPMTIATGSTQGCPILCCGGGNFSATGAAFRKQPRAHAAAAAGESVLGPTAEEASTDSRHSTFFHMSFTVTIKMLGQDAAEWTKGVEESLATYVSKNCVEGIVVQSYHDTTLQLEAAFLFSENRLGAPLRHRLRTETIQI